MWGDEPGCHRQEVGVKRAGQEQDGGGWGEACGMLVEFLSRVGSKLRGTSGVDYRHFLLCIIRSVSMPGNLQQ